jgi:hypothetical protein
VKSLLVLWDPRNAQVPVGPVIDALQDDPELDVRVLTFDDIGHQTLPNFSFRHPRVLSPKPPDAVLWVEGGPLPADLDRFRGRAACWLVNTHLEPSLMEDLRSAFDVIFTTHLRDTADERARWLPLSAGVGDPVSPPGGVSILRDDPKPPAHAEAEQALVAAAPEFGRSAVPVVVALSNGGRPHPMVFEALRSGAAVVTDADSDLRGIACPGEHADVAPSGDHLAGFVRDLVSDSNRLRRLSARGPAIVAHLHQPAMRAAQIREGIWPSRRILSGQEYRPRVSILVTCYRYLRRFSVCLESLARQELPPGSLEIVVADPGSPDGLALHLERFAAKHSGVSVVHLPIDPRYHRNRGVAINRAFDESRGAVVIGIDGDLVFPPTLVGFLEEQVLQSPDRVFGVRRSFVRREDTERILSGELDPFADFERLALSEGDGEENPFVGVLGYCQAVDRKAFARARYPEEFDKVNQSDIVFVERLRREAGVQPAFLEDRIVLHLWHPRNWQGTTENL